MSVGINVASDSSQLFETDESLARRKRRESARRALSGSHALFPSDEDAASSACTAAASEPLGRPLEAGGKVLALLIPERDYSRKTAFLGESTSVAREIDLEDGTTIKLFKHSGPVTCLAFYRERDGNEILLTGSWDKTIKQWNVATKANVGNFTGHSDFVKCLAVSADGRTAWSGSSDSTIREWGLATEGSNEKGERRVLKGHGRGVEDVKFITDKATGKAFLFSCSSDRSVRQWDAATGAEVRRFEGHLTSVYALYLGEDALWSASADKTARRWEVETGKEDSSYQHPDFVKCLAVVGPYLITGCRDEVIRIFDIASGKCLRKIEGHFDEVSCMAVAGGTLFTGSLDSTLRRWCLRDIVESPEPTATGTLPADKVRKATQLAGAAAMTAEEEAELAELLGEE